MAVKFNSKLSGRKQIDPSSFDITFEKPERDEPDAAPRINIKRFENDHGFDSGAALVLRIKDQRDYIALECGTVDNPQSPPASALDNFIRTSYRYQIRVVSKDPSKKALILGSSSVGTKVVDDADVVTHGMLDFVRSDINPFLWKLDINPDDGPKLLINKNIPNITDLFANNPIVQISILPTVTREILRAVYSDGANTLDSIWKRNWHDWATSKNENELPLGNEPQQMEDWISRTVEISLEDHDLINTVINEMERKDG